MKVFWKEDGEKIDNDKLGNPIYDQDEYSGTIVGTYQRKGHGYPYILIALDNGRFISRDSSDCYHKNTLSPNIKFAKEIYPLLEGRYRIFQATSDKLIGQNVYAIRSGFGCNSTGREMTIESIKGEWITLIDPFGSDSKWSSKMSEKHNDFIFIDDYNKINNK